ncbi:MAG: hypothetical protein GY711_10760 [bacterium]|nr:hypothetical protein [bacterium]
MSDDSQSGAAGPRGLRRVLRILLWQLLILVALVELVPRVIPVPGLRSADLKPAFIDSERNRRLEPHPYLVGAPKPHWTSTAKQKQASHNSFGLRGAEVTLEKPAGTRRIVCLGGSSTYGNGPTKDEATWPARLESKLNHLRSGVPVQVINAGAPSWSTFESLINLGTRMVAFEPDLVLVYHATNDVTPALWPGARFDNLHFRRTWPTVRPSPVEPYLERSMIYLIWRKYGTSYLTERADLGFYGIRDYRADYTDPFGDGPFPRTGFEGFERNLRSIVATARAHGARVLLITQANWATDDDNFITGKNRHRAIGEMTEITKALAAELDVALLDAKPQLEERARSQMAERDKQNVFTNGVHLRDPGANFLATLIADFVLSENLLP